MLGRRAVRDQLPYFFSDQYDVGMDSPVGSPAADTTPWFIRGDVEAQAFHSFWLAGDRVMAGMHVNCWDEGIAPAQDLIRACRPVDARRLSDTSVPLTDLVDA